VAQHDAARLVAEEPGAGRSYDDLPESDVATVLQVPLLWSAAPSASQIERSGRSVSGVRGRHRATPTTSTSRRHTGSRRSRWTDHPLATALRVGVISGVLVIVGFAVALLGLAAWLP
jgi:hypothetical protein